MADEKLPPFQGCRGQSVGRCGATHEELRSALQKHIRRGEVDQAVRAAVEFDRFGEHGTVANPIRSNLYNRLAIIAMEDVGLANLPLLLEVNARLREWKETRDTDAGRRTLVSVVRALAASPKSRLVSHARAVFADPRGRVVAAAHGFSAHHPDAPGVALTFERTERADAQRYQTNLEYCLDKRDDAAVYWARRLANTTLKVARDRSHAGIAAVWQSILAVARAVDADVGVIYLLALQRWHREMRSKTEDFCFAVCAILAITRPDPVNRDDGFALVPQAEVDALYAVCPRVEIPDYARDKHTTAGRAEGKDATDFALEGARINNAAPWAADTAYEAVYQELRAPPRESDVFADAVRAQLRDAAHERMGAARPYAHSGFHGKSCDPVLFGTIEGGPRSGPLSSVRITQKAQLVTSEAKTCTYVARVTYSTERQTKTFAALGYREGAQVFVKGPLDPRAAALQVRVDAAKAHLPGMRPVKYQIAHLVPDFFPDTPLGRRKRVDRGRPAVFLVAPDLCNPNGDIEVPTVMHGSKVWPETKVRAPMDSDTDIEHPDARLLLALCFRYALGVGDTCDRNLLTVGGQTYSLDEETCFKTYPAPRLGNARLATALARVADLWDAVLESLREWPAALAAMPAVLSKKEREFATARVQEMLETGPELLYRPRRE